MWAIYLLPYLNMKELKPSREEIVSHIFLYFDDLDFMEKLNELTYSRKVQLKNKFKTGLVDVN